MFEMADSIFGVGNGVIILGILSILITIITCWILHVVFVFTPPESYSLNTSQFDE